MPSCLRQCNLQLKYGTLKLLCHNGDNKVNQKDGMVRKEVWIFVDLIIKTVEGFSDKK
jgi:hypothetical protein